MSTASQKRSRGVSVNRPSRSSAAAKATEWTSRSSRPSQVSATSPKTRSTSSSARTSQGVTSFEPTDEASSRTLLSIRSPWKVKASSAPSSARRLAIAHAIERLLATPMIRARFPANRATWRSYGYSAVRAPPRRIPRTRRGADRHVGCCRCLPADRAASRRAGDPARPRREDHGPGRSPQGPHHRHPDAVRPATRRLLAHALRQQRHAPAERAEPRREGLRRQAAAGAAGRRRFAEARDPERHSRAQLHAAPERDGRRAAGDAAGEGGESSPSRASSTRATATRSRSTAARA